MALWVIFASAVVLLTLPLSTYSNPDGAPISACGLRKYHPGSPTSDSPGGFFIDTNLRDTNFAYSYNRSLQENYTITLFSTGVPFRGFIIQVTPSNSFIPTGSLVDLPPSAKRLNCGDPSTGAGPDATVTHTDNLDKTSVTVTWLPYPGKHISGVARIRYSVVTEYNMSYYSFLDVADYPPPPPDCPPAPVNVSDIPNYPLSFGFPEGCQRASCDYFVGMGPNPVNNSYLDIYLEGDTQGWLALGFSKDRRMNGTDVIGCRVLNSNADVVDSWNPASRLSLQNHFDTTQEGVCPSLTLYQNGRVTCRLSRLVAITNIGEDLNLNSQYFLILGRRRLAFKSTSSLSAHWPDIPISTVRMFNPMTDSFTNIQTGMLPVTPPTTEPPNLDCPPIPNPDTIRYSFTYGSPGGSYFFGARVNPDNANYLDMRLEGDTTGWVAIGFTETRSMEESDVIGCMRDPATGMASILDTWNPGPQGSRTPNQLDGIQDNLPCGYVTEVVNGRISCTFRRLAASQSDRDFNLSKPLFQIYGMSSNGGPSTSGLPIHVPNTPQISTARVNVVEDRTSGADLMTGYKGWQLLLVTLGLFYLVL